MTNDKSEAAEPKDGRWENVLIEGPPQSWTPPWQKKGHRFKRDTATDLAAQPDGRIYIPDEAEYAFWLARVLGEEHGPVAARAILRIAREDEFDTRAIYEAALDSWRAQHPGSTSHLSYDEVEPDNEPGEDAGDEDYANSGMYEDIGSEDSMEGYNPEKPFLVGDEHCYWILRPRPND